MISSRFLSILYCICILTTISCTEVWDIRGKDASNEYDHILSVAANATFDNDRLAFAAAVAPLRPLLLGESDLVEHPVDNLILEIKVDGVSYSCETMVKDSLFGGETGFILEGIPVSDRSTHSVDMLISDRNGYYNPVSASGNTMRKPEMRVDVFAIPSENWFPEDQIKQWEEMKRTRTDLEFSEFRGPDSLYCARITIDPEDREAHYYLLSVEFDFYDAPGPLSIAPSRRYVPDYSKKITLGEVPFQSDDNLFYDGKISSSLSGFPVYFSNIFSNEKSKGGIINATIRFCSPALDMFRIVEEDGDGLDRRTAKYPFYSNAQSPFHIYLCELDADTYEYYKSVQHQVCSSNSIFEAQISAPSNIIGGLGFFSVHNRQDFRYLDDTIYNSAWPRNTP